MGFGKNLKTKLYSGDNLINLSDVRYLPRWIILAIDIGLIFLATLFSCYIIEKLSYNKDVFYNNVNMYALIIGVNLVYMYLFRTYAGIIRHSTFIDLFKLLLATFCSTVTVAVISYGYYLLFGIKLIIAPVSYTHLDVYKRQGSQSGGQLYYISLEKTGYF